jgi:hypothetical protein
LTRSRRSRLPPLLGPRPVFACCSSCSALHPSLDLDLPLALRRDREHERARSDADVQLPISRSQP